MCELVLWRDHSHYLPSIWKHTWRLLFESFTGCKVRVKSLVIHCRHGTWLRPCPKEIIRNEILLCSIILLSHSNKVTTHNRKYVSKMLALSERRNIIKIMCGQDNCMRVKIQKIIKEYKKQVKECGMISTMTIVMWSGLTLLVTMRTIG